MKGRELIMCINDSGCTLIVIGMSISLSKIPYFWYVLRVTK